MAKQTAEVVPGEVSQAQWDGKFDTTTKKLNAMGGAQTSDDLTEGAANKYDTGVPPATQDDLPDGAAAKQFSATEQTKLGGVDEGAEVNPANLAALDPTQNTKLTGIEAGAEVNPADLAALDPTANTKLGGIEESATVDQTGAEIRDAVVALGDTERKILITDPLTGEFKVLGVHRNAAGNLEYDYDDVPES